MKISRLNVSFCACRLIIWIYHLRNNYWWIVRYVEFVNPNYLLHSFDYKKCVQWYHTWNMRVWTVYTNKQFLAIGTNASSNKSPHFYPFPRFLLQSMVHLYVFRSNFYLIEKRVYTQVNIRTFTRMCYCLSNFVLTYSF